MSMDSKQPPSSPPVRALGEHLETMLDRAARAAEPPDYTQLAAYVDGTLDDVEREIVESWIASDPELRAEVEDLRALHDAMAVPVAAPAAGTASMTASVSSRSATLPSLSAIPAETFAEKAADGGVTTGAHDAATASAGAAVRSTTASGSRAPTLLPFEHRVTRSGGVATRRLGTATVIVGAMAAAVIGAVTWMVVRSVRIDEARPGAGWGAGSQVARQGTQAEGQETGPALQRPAAQSQAPSQAPSQSPESGRSPSGTGGAGATVAGAARSRAAGADAVMVRDGGGVIAVDATGNVLGLSGDVQGDGEAATPAMTQLVADALMRGAVPGASAAAGLGGRELTLMSRGGGRQASEAALAPLSPIATIVRSQRPAFRWSAHPGARGYVVTIYGPDFDRVMTSPVVTDNTTWTPTEALKPGVTYQWQVTADTPEGPVRAPAPPAPDARFRIIAAAAGGTLERDLTRAGSSQLLKGLLLAQAGVLDEAEQAFEVLRAANPDSTRVADLLARVRERRLAP